MNAIIVFTTTGFFLFISESVALGFASITSENTTNIYLNTLQIIRKNGYPAEAHIVETADGYLLEVHRIPPQGPSFEESRKPPVFIQHGVFGSSADFTFISPQNALAFVLSDLGFDVWLGNIRGNTYSRFHTTLFPNDRKFWNFSWHESAIYDLPAQIDYILDYTQHEKVIYIGHSMGTTVFLAMTSALPEYNDKIEVSLLMAAVGYLKNVKSPLLRILAPFSGTLKAVDEFIANGEILPNSRLLRMLGKIFCEKTQTERDVCMNAIFLITGCDPKQFDQEFLPVLLNHYPQGYSAKGLNHYSQLIKSGEFRQYDYGSKGNIQQYGTSTPPNYNLSLITTPVFIYEGENDYLSTVEDADRVAKQLPNLRRFRVVDYPAFNHLDFLAAIDVKKLLYDILIEDMMSHLSDDNEVYF